MNVSNYSNKLWRWLLANEKYVFPLACFLISFLIYLITLCRTVYWGDSGEFITAIHTLGIPHPTGYPVYVLIGKLFALVPLGSIAWRINMMSAFFASLTVMLTYVVAYKISKSEVASFIAATTLGASLALWYTATIAEVYSLNDFFMILNFLILLWWQEKQDIRLLYLFFFTYGLSLTNHITSILLFPAFMYFIAVHKQEGLFSVKWYKKIFKPKIIFLCIIFLLIGLLPYLYLPIRSSMNPVIDWGNPETPSNFLNHITGREFSEKYMGELEIASNIQNFFIIFFTSYMGLILFMLIGVYYTLTHLKKVKTSLFLLLIFLTYLLFNITYSIGDIVNYYIPVLIVASIFVGVGLAHVIKLINKDILKILLLLLIIGAPVLLTVSSSGINKSGDYSTRSYANFVFDSVDNNSVLLTNRDEHAVLHYYQFVEGERPDLIITPLQCIKDDFCVQQLEQRNYVFVTKDFGDLVSMDQVILFVDEMEPRKVYGTDFYNPPQKNNRSTWKLFLLSRETES